MAKYSYEFKIKAVEAYLNGEVSYDYVSKKNNIPATSRLKEWVAAYKEFGKKGLMQSRKNTLFNSNFLW